MTLVQTTADKIKTKSYWAITIRPARFDEHRVPDRSSLFTLVHDSAVSTNGRIIPALDQHEESLRVGPDWIESSSEWSTDLQAWRFYQSGQFVLLLAVWTDWIEDPALHQKSHTMGRTLPLWDSLATISATYTFAARLSLTVAGDSAMVVTMSIADIKGARLVQDNLKKTPLRHYVYPGDSFEYPTGRPVQIAREQLVGNAKQLAAEAGYDLLRRFGFDTTVEMVARWQSEM
jgi:hypothetical protein